MGYKAQNLLIEVTENESVIKSLQEQIRALERQIKQAHSEMDMWKTVANGYEAKKQKMDQELKDVQTKIHERNQFLENQKKLIDSWVKEKVQELEEYQNKFDEFKQDFDYSEQKYYSNFMEQLKEQLGELQEAPEFEDEWEL